MAKRLRSAVILAGCGSKDGSEITEAVSLLIALSQRSPKELEYEIFAPDRPMFHTINHVNGQVLEQKRNMMEESARIARGHLQPLTQCDPSRYDALFLPGGFGTAKNLCDYAFHGAQAKLEKDIENLLLMAIADKKLISSMCISPMIVALAMAKSGKKSFRLTLGDGQHEDEIQSLEKWGGIHQPCRNGEACVDTEFRLISVPAYMINHASPADIFNCATALVAGTIDLFNRIN